MNGLQFVILFILFFSLVNETVVVFHLRRFRAPTHRSLIRTYTSTDRAYTRFEDTRMDDEERDERREFPSKNGYVPEFEE